MTEEEQPASVVGGVEEAVGAAWDAGGQVIDAAGNAASAAGSYTAAAYENVAATGNEFIGDYAARDAHDKAFDQDTHEGDASWDQAGQNLSDAGTDIVGQ